MTTDADAPTQHTFAEAEAFGALQRTTAQAEAVDQALLQATQVLDAGNLPKLAHEVQRARELHRLFMVRLASITRRVGEGAP